MIARESSMNCHPVRFIDRTQCSISDWPRCSANTAEKMAEPMRSQQTIPA
jgi:hypothetical protein